jgi:hypothetical protein
MPAIDPSKTGRSLSLKIGAQKKAPTIVDAQVNIRLSRKSRFKLWFLDECKTHRESGLFRDHLHPGQYQKFVH